MAKERKIVTNYKSSLKYQNIKTSLLEQLNSNHTHGNHYEDLVEDYMSLWITKCLLIDDINSRGVSVNWNNGGGQRGKKKNDSVSELVKVNAQMLKLLNELGLKTNDLTNGDDENDEL